MARAVVVLALSAIALFVAVVAWDFYSDSRAGEVYEASTRGDPEARIVGRLGEPDRIEACPDHLSWNGDQFDPPPNNGQCVKWSSYSHFLSRWAFGYSAAGKLVSRYHYVSE